MAEHRQRTTSTFHFGEGRKFTAHCDPCNWHSQSHRAENDANADFQAHTSPKVAFYEPTDLELTNYGLHPSLVTGQQYGTDPRGRRG